MPKKKKPTEDTLKWRGLEFKRPTDATPDAIVQLIWTCEIQPFGKETGKFIIDVTRSESAVQEAMKAPNIEAFLYGPGGHAIAEGASTSVPSALDALMARLHDVDRIVRWVMSAEAREGHVVHSRPMKFSTSVREPGTPKLKVATFRRVAAPSADQIAGAKVRKPFPSKLDLAMKRQAKEKAKKKAKKAKEASSRGTRIDGSTRMGE